MKNIIGCTLLLLCISCSKKDSNVSTPVVSDFEMVVTGSSPSANIKFMNKSTGATSYIWSFGEGSNVTTATDINPADITVDKAGVFTVSLQATSQAVTKITTKSITVNGINGLKEFSNLKFGDRVIGSVPFLFSTSTGSFYSPNQINNEEGPKIDIVYFKLGLNFGHSFLPPDTAYRSGFTPNGQEATPIFIPGARFTKVLNCSGNAYINSAQYDAMITDSLLKTLNIYHEPCSRISNFPSLYPQFVYFINADNKRGVIRIKSLALDQSYVLADIKVQKYQ
jgi:PKD repeat protein